MQHSRPSTARGYRGLRYARRSTTQLRRVAERVGMPGAATLDRSDLIAGLNRRAAIQRLRSSAW